MAAIPPPRYRVVERGRRLEVIDTHAGGARASSRPPRASMLARAPDLLTSKPARAEPTARLVLGWSALVAVSFALVFTFVTFGVQGFAVLLAGGTALYTQNRDRIRDWIARLG